MLSQKIVSFSQVLTEGRLLLEFTCDEYMRIRNWHFVVRQHQELVSRSVLMTDPGVMDELSKNITIKGMTRSTLNYLKVSFDSFYVLDKVIKH